MDAGPQGGPGMVLIRDGKIDEVRQGANLQPPKGFQVIRGAYVTPGLIDADTTTGYVRRLQHPRRSGSGRVDRPEYGGRECTR